MARPLRFAPADVPQHVWCRGNQKQPVFFDDHDRRRYQDLLVQHAREFAVRILGYCQMTNHVHLVLQPSTDNALSAMMARLNSEHAQEVQFRAQRTGHLWHARFHAAPMDSSYLWTALRYVELNPVRAGMVRHPEEWPWSSAAAHLSLVDSPDWLDCEAWAHGWGRSDWRAFLDTAVKPEETARLRQSTRHDRPLASEIVARRWERDYGVRLLPRPPGRAPKPRVAQNSAVG